MLKKCKKLNFWEVLTMEKQYIKDKLQLSHLQDLYHKRLTEKGY